MKTFTHLYKGLFSASAALLVAGFFVLSGCEKSDPASDSSSNLGDAGAKPITKNTLVLPFFVEGANQEWWANLSDNSNLYEKRTHAQILGPDGHPITWGEWNRVTGSAKVNCTGQGTRLNVSIDGLIANGIYSMWVMPFQPPGFDTAYTNVSGFGAAGAPDGSENVFKASSTGSARFHVSIPAGPLSSFGSVSGCIPSDEYEVHFVGIYHIDGKPGTTTPGPAGKYVEQFAFLIVNH
jgi:hypothetical protein